MAGLQLIMEHSVVDTIKELAETSVVPSVKGTCFYCLCMVAQTISGVEILSNLGWNVSLLLMHLCCFRTMAHMRHSSTICSNLTVLLTTTVI